MKSKIPAGVAKFSVKVCNARDFLLMHRICFKLTKHKQASLLRLKVNGCVYLRTHVNSRRMDWAANAYIAHLENKWMRRSEGSSDQVNKVSNKNFSKLQLRKLQQRNKMSTTYANTHILTHVDYAHFFRLSHLGQWPDIRSHYSRKAPRCWSLPKLTENKNECINTNRRGSIG